MKTKRKTERKSKKRQISKIPLEEGSEVKGNMGDRMIVRDHRFVLAEREEAGS